MAGSISDELKKRGYGHRKVHGEYGKREVYELATGKVVGLFSAHEAIERFLKTNRRKQAA